MAETKKKSTTTKKKTTTTKKTTTKAVKEPVEIKEEVAPVIEEEVVEKAPEKPKKDEAYELLLAKIADLEAKLAEKSNAVQIVQYQDAEMVELLWQAPVADDNVVMFGENGQYGRITGKTGVFYVPKREMPRILDSRTNTFLNKRWLIVLSGLTDDERDNIGVNYKDGEVLDRRAFANMIDLGEDILAIYPKLCKGHQEIVEKAFYEAYKSGKNIQRDVVVKLNKLSAKAGNAHGGFQEIIEEMNAKDAER